MVTVINENLIAWGSDIEAGTIAQAEKVSRLPILAGPVALMADAHVGIGATVGSVIATDGAVIPSAVGVDIGCGMIAAELDVTALQLPDDLGLLLGRIERAIPAGVGRGHKSGSGAAGQWLAAHRPASVLSERQITTVLRQFGTLGSGNHFFEVCLDERDRLWVVLHSGSRGIGNQLAQAHIATARSLAATLEHRLEDPDLAWFNEGTDEFQAYVTDMLWAQDYARANRDQMMDNALTQVVAFLGHGRETFRVNCHHNFCQQERHAVGGEERTMWITRKGAIKADTGEYGVIPGSMDLARQMAGKVWQADKAEALIDEIPSAYKDIDQVMADQSDLVRICHTLHQILNYKGT